nr:MAG TPA: hypothetical protein [Caudoviricetes sp.]
MRSFSRKRGFDISGLAACVFTAGSALPPGAVVQ